MKKPKKINEYFMGVFYVFISFIILLGLVSIVFPMDLLNFVTSSTFRLASSFEEDHWFVNNTAEFCNYPNPTDQVRCVTLMVDTYYNYSINRTANKNIQGTEEFLKNPSLCRDAVIMQDKIFRKLGWQTGFIFVPNHVYLSISKKTSIGRLYYCEVDLPDFTCSRGI